MKRMCIVIFVLACLFSLPCAAKENELRGVWVSTVYCLDYPSAQGLSEEKLKAEAMEIINNVKLWGLNAIFLQVRPTADSFYPSEIFPWSAWLSGVQGQAPQNGFDPLDYFVKQAHAQGIQIHAWINPYRITRTGFASKEAALNSLSENHPARKHPEWVSFYTDGNLYFDPGIPEVRDLICRGVLEIVQKYPVDGIHLDDYFYPGTDFNDQDTYQKYGSAFSKMGDFRRDAVNQLISTLHEKIKSASKNVRFGVSPFGIWGNSSDHPEGSNTIGGESYDQYYADSRKWVMENWVDYICPQLYWYTGSREGEFSTLLGWWQDLTAKTKVQLYIGVAAYRLTEATAGSPWTTDEIKREIEQISASQASGSVFFRYRSLLTQQGLSELISKTYSAEVKSSGLTLSVTRPEQAIKTSLRQFYVTGSSDPTSPLTINGEVMARRSQAGYFGILLSLKLGQNTFTFKNGNKTTNVSIYRNIQAGGISFPAPQGNYILKEGESLPLSCSANKNSLVSVLLSGSITALKPKEDKGTFTGKMTLTASSSPDTPVGIPLFVAEKSGMLLVSFSASPVYVRQSTGNITATITTDRCDVYPQPDPAKGATAFLRNGMVTDVKRVENGYALLTGVGYVKAENVSLSYGSSLPRANVTSFSVSQQDQWRMLEFHTGRPSAGWAEYRDGKIRVSIAGADEGFLLDNSWFQKVEVTASDGVVCYVLTPTAGVKVSGYYTESSSGGLRLWMKSAPVPSKGLQGITVMLDPGHGGQALGAVGVSPDTVEKDLNLRYSNRLAELLKAAGATVYLTRTEDKDISLTERMADSFEKKPDVFLSLHSNSAKDDTDMSVLSGISIYAKSDLSQGLGEAMKTAFTGIGRNCKSTVTQSGLYVLRGEHALSLLIENEYITSPFGFTILESNAETERYCSAIVSALQSYFKPAAS